MVTCLVAPASLAERISYTARISARDISLESSDGLVRVSVDQPGFLRLTHTRRPDLPYRIVSLLLPQGHDVSDFQFSATSATSLAKRGHTLALAALSQDGKTASAGNDEIPSVYPGGWGEFLGVGHFRGYTLASFAVYPVRLETGSIVLYPEIMIDVDTSPGGRDAIAPMRFRPEQRAKAEMLLSQMVANPRMTARYRFSSKRVEGPARFQPSTFPSLEGSAVDYVIVTTDALASAYQKLADWKTAKGVPTVVRTTEWITANYRNGSDLQETIRTFVLDAYEKWGIQYLLLGGDTNEVPARMAWSSYHDGGRFLPVDMYYGCLDGDWNKDGDSIFGEAGSEDAPDLYPEISVGRLPTSTPAEVNVQVGKIKAYEMPNAVDFSGRVLMLAEVLFPYNWVSPQTITLDGAELSNDVYTASLTNPALDVVRLYQTDNLYPGSVPLSVGSSIDSINVGFNHVVHIGHGFRYNMSLANGCIVNGDADVFYNGEALSNLFLLNCTAVAYTYYCLGEHFMRNPNGGAVSVIGANESAYPSIARLYMNKYYDLLFNDDVVHLGEAWVQARLPRTPLASISDNLDFYTHYIFSVLGDPEMPLWTGPVDTLSVSHVDSVGLGTTSIVATVTDGAGPVDSVLVCFSKDDEDYQYGFTDLSGQVSFDFRAESEGEITVVATGLNYVRRESAIVVSAAAGAYVTFQGLVVGDDSTSLTLGNGDGRIDSGEVAELWFDVKNTGLSASGNVDLVLRTNTANVFIIDSTAAVGVVDSAETASSLDPFLVLFLSSLADEAVVDFDLIVKENGVEKWRDEIKKIVHAPDLVGVAVRIDDAASGNGDGIVNPGEQFDLYYEIKNFGTGASTLLSVNIVDPAGGFVLTTNFDTYGIIQPFTTSENAVGFTMTEPDTTTEHELQFTISDVFGRSFRDTIELRPPDPPDAITVDPQLGPDRLELKWHVSPSPDAEFYNVYRSSVPGGPYTRANVDPVMHPSFLDLGLAGSTLYYYVVTTVDESGNESVSTQEFSGSTNPEQVVGWPIAMEAETSSSPVVGDIDGDGYLEIVVADKQIYAWHHDGIEVLDGDGDPQSWGVLTTLGGNFVSHIALAQIDGTIGLEIIAAARNDKQVYVLDGTGTPLPGWPQTIENTIRSGMVVGDLDGDGDFEIVAIDEKGVMYAWFADGSEFIDGDKNPMTQGVFFRFPGCTFQYSTPAIADIDGDGKDEIIVGTDADSLYILDDDASVKPGWPFALSSDVSGSPAIGDVDDDGDLEIVVNTRAGNVWALHDDASQLWFQFIVNNQVFGPSPALADVNNNGKLETFLPGSNGRLYAINDNGDFLPGWPVQFGNTRTESSPIIADIDGDGSLDILIGDETQYIFAWDTGGTLLAGFPLATEDAMRGVPTIIDVDFDRDVDLVAAGWDKTVYVWDFPAFYDPSKAPWPGFHGNIHNSGLLGAIIPTGISGVSFSFDIRSRGVELMWEVPSHGGDLFDVSRAEVELSGGMPGVFERVAISVVADQDGVVRHVDLRVEMGTAYIYRLETSEDTEEVHRSPVVYVPVTRASLGQNYPNPFNPTTEIVYFVPDGVTGRVSLTIYDVRGARVRTLYEGKGAGGKHRSRWDGRDDMGSRVSTGVYFYRLVLPGFIATRKMVLLK